MLAPHRGTAGRAALPGDRSDDRRRAASARNVELGPRQPISGRSALQDDLNQGLPAGTITTAAKPPLARNELLRTAITAHLLYLQENNLFSHTGSNNSTSKQRIVDAGVYPLSQNRRKPRPLGGTHWLSLPEIRQVAANLLNEWFKSPPHRESFMDSEFREVGIAMVTGPFRYEGTAYTAGLGGQNLGKRDVDPFLTGVGCRTKLTDFPIRDVTTAIRVQR